MNIEPLRVLQLSDMHILAEAKATLYGVDSFAAFKSLLTIMQSDSWKPHVAIATGDLSQDGSAESYRRLRRLLTPLEFPVYCVPGNHDDVPTMDAHLKGGSIFVERFVRLESWHIVFLNSQVPGEEHGALSDNELAALEETLRLAPSCPTLVALHHGPLSPCPMPQCQLQNADALLAILSRQSQVSGVISGHIHCEVDKHHRGVRMMVTPSTFLHADHPSGTEVREWSKLEEPHAFDPGRRGVRRLELYPDGQIDTRVIWSNEGQFE